ncbi:MAG: GDP-mannose 4,6-dehydratase, partial [uncultured Acidimicrobiales bacterium]
EHARPHHRHHRPGRLPPGRAAARQGLRRGRDGAAQQHGELRAHRPHPGPDHLRPGRPARRGVDDQHAPGAPTGGGLQPRSPELRPDELRPARAHRRDDGPRCDPDARRHPHRGPGHPLLPGQLERDVRQGPGGPAVGVDAVLPPLPLRRGQALRPLDHHQLPGELRPARLVGHPLQPRGAAARPRVRDPEDHPHRRQDQARDGDRAPARQPRRPAGLGLRRRLRRGHVAHAPAGRARRLRGGHRRDARGAGVLRGGLRARGPRLPRLRRAGRALHATGRGRPPRRRPEQGPRRPRLGAPDVVPRPRDDDGGRRPRAPAGRPAQHQRQL